MAIRLAVGVLAVALVGCVGAPRPEDEWVGEYDGAYECTGDLPESGGQTIIIDQRDYGGIFVNGRGCDVPLTLVDDEHAIIPDGVECDTALPNGDNVTVIYEVGNAFLTGSFLDWTYDALLLNHSLREAFRAHCEFSGRRAR